MTAIRTQGFAHTSAQPAHAALAIARLGGDAGKAKQIAGVLGFQEVARNNFRHPDGSWAKITGSTVQVGYQREVLSGVQGSILDLPSIAVADVPASAAARKITANIAFGDQAAYTARLTREGFTQVLPNYFSHNDGSWVAVIDGAAVRGVNGQRIGKLPKALQATSKAVQHIGQGGSVQSSGLNAQSAAALPTVQPTFDDAFLACAQAPFLRDNSATRALAALGLVRKSPGFWEAVDGSWIAQSGNGFERGYLQSRFQGVPASLQRMTSRPPCAADLGLAVGNPSLAKLTAADILASDQSLLDAGFIKQRSAVYAHPDGSRVAIVGNTLRFGAGSVLLTAAPKLSQLPVNPVTVQSITAWQSVWDLPTDSLATLLTGLIRKGFSETRSGFFQSTKDGTWVATDGTTHRFGDASSCYDVLPSPAALPRGEPSPEHRWLAIAQTGAITGATARLSQKLGALGFVSAGTKFFTHQDGSWLAIRDDNVVRGVDGLVLTKLPTTSKQGKYPVYSRLPSTSDWTWYQKNTALGHTPLLGDKTEARRTLARLGYQEGKKDRWTHPDGSYVHFQGSGGLQLGWQKWTLGQLPYNNRVPGS